MSFSSDYDADFDVAPSLAAAAGTYDGKVGLASRGREFVVMTIAVDGTVTGSAPDCNFGGTAATRIDGNAFNVSLTFGPDRCFFANQTLTGVMYFDSRTRRIYAAVPNAARTDGLVLFGTKR